MSKKINEEGEGGADLPTVGNAIAKVANSGPGKALLTPAATAFGKYLGWRTEEMTEQWKKQRETNVENHAEKVKKREGEPIVRQPSEKQIDLVNEWADRAQEVDPQDQEIAALWQSLLAAIYRKEIAAAEWLAVIRQLDERDAMFLIRVPRRFVPRTPRERTLCDKFAKIGLMDKPDLWRIGLPLATAAFLSAFAILAALLLSISPDHSSLEYSPLQIARLRPYALVFGLTGIVVTGMLGLVVFSNTRQYRLTDLGTDIQGSARDYLDRPVTSQERQEPASARRRGLAADTTA